MNKRPRWLKWLGILFAALILTIIISVWWLHEPLPKGKPVPQADELAIKMLEAINKEAWDSTRYIQWTFKGMHHFLWDKSRHYTIVEWDDKKVLLNINTKTGRAWKKETETTGKLAESLVQQAWEYWANDSFWLNAPAKVFDPGTSRSLVDLEDGSAALLVTYSSGGVTPGDSYLWKLDADGLPKSWKMWVSIIPIGGLEFSWEEWVTLPGGAKIARTHQNPLLTLDMTNIKAAQNFKDLGFLTDPFAGIEN